jgi:hypothetical protein
MIKALNACYNLFGMKISNPTVFGVYMALLTAITAVTVYTTAKEMSNP